MAETGFKYDVFISYSHKDEGWADKVLRQRLDDAGLKVCIDYRDFEAGKMALLNMQDAAKQSKHVVLILTRSWLNSEWSLFEALVGGTKDPAGLQKKLIPLLCEDGIQNDINDFIAMRTWVDFTRKDREDIAWKQLFASFGRLEAFQPGSKTADPVSRDTWNLTHPYPMPPNFTGRAAEQQLLDNWLADDKDRLFILRALGGFGKSALAWQWINTHVNPTEWTKLVFWSFYEGDASFENFIEETLKYLKIEPPQGQREQVDKLLNALQSQKVLLIMDGFERLLRAYGNMNASHQGDEDKKLKDADRDCINLNVEHFLKGFCSLPNMKSKSLMTTRLTPRALEKFGQFIQGCREEELKAMHKDDAIAFFRAQGVRKGTNHEIEEVCKLYGFHPLSLRLLAGHIITDLKNAGDIIVAQKLKASGDIMEHQNHILEIAYDGLPRRQQKLLSTIACLRSSTKLDTLDAIAENKDLLDEDLHDLMERGLVQFDRHNSIFDLHPIVRRFAYDRLTIPDRTSAHVVLVVYFEAIPQPRKVEKLEDLAPVIELYHHMVRAGKLDDAWLLFRDSIWKTLYYQLGGYQTQIELLSALFLDGENNLPNLKKESHQVHCLNELANAYARSGQPHRAEPLYLASIEPDEKSGNKRDVAIGLGNVAYMAQLHIGALSEAEHNLRRSIEFCLEIEDEFWEGISRQEIGRVLSYRGVWHEAQKELDAALAIHEKIDAIEGQGNTWLYLALSFLLKTRAEEERLQIEGRKSAIASATHALKLIEDTARTRFHYEAQFVEVNWILGAAYRLDNQLDLAESHLSEAITRDRSTNNVMNEADILLDLARLRYDQKNYEEAKSLANEALLTTERCGYVLQGADVNLFLAQYALEQEKDKVKAKEYAETALKLAYCDGPPYYYKVAYDEAVAMLERLKV